MNFGVEEFGNGPGTVLVASQTPLVAELGLEKFQELENEEVIDCIQTKNRTVGRVLRLTTLSPIFEVRK